MEKTAYFGKRSLEGGNFKIFKSQHANTNK